MVYPFSMAKYGHTIELVRDNLYLQDKMDEYKEVTDVLLELKVNSDGKVAWVDGQVIGKAKEIVAYGECLRDDLNGKAHTKSNF